MMLSKELTPHELLRYSKQVILPNIGKNGQDRIKASKILIIGVGGLGSPAALYLAAAGVGKIGLIDFDSVDISNLQRQIIYSTSDVNKSKVIAAQSRLTEINPHIEIKIYNQKAVYENLREILPEYDLIIDGSDNFSTRFVINEASHHLQRPLLSAAIQGFSGQLALFNHAQGPCLRCLYPHQPPADFFPNCSEAGVLGPIAGVMGSLLASEALKYTLGLISHDAYILNYDALNLKFSKIKLNKAATCPLCSLSTTHESLHVEKTNHTTQVPYSNDFSEDALDVEELARNFNSFQLVDIREARERELGEISPSIHLPFISFQNLKADNLEANSLVADNLETKNIISAFQTNKTIVLYCQSDLRSRKALGLLKEILFKENKHPKSLLFLKGGYLAWLKKNQ